MILDNKGRFMSSQHDRENEFDPEKDVFAGDLGPAMARASVAGVAARLGLTPPLAPRDLACLLDALAPGLAVFVGREQAEQTLVELRARLGVGGAR